MHGCMGYACLVTLQELCFWLSRYFAKAIVMMILCSLLVIVRYLYTSPCMVVSLFYSNTSNQYFLQHFQTEKMDLEDRLLKQLILYIAVITAVAKLTNATSESESTEH